MSKMKKYLLTGISFVLVAALAIGGTFAYLTSEDSDVNVMTLGNVKIAQHEYQRAQGVAHDAGDVGAGNGVTEGALVPFVQGQALYPAVPKNNAPTDYTAEQATEDLFFWGDYVYSGTAGNGLWDDAKLSNVMDKMVFVENTGKSDAYFRTILAFECPEGITIGEPANGAEIMTNTNGSTVYDWDNIGFITIDGVRYLVEVATYQNALKPGNQSHPSLLQVVMTHNATNEDMALLGDTYDILVLSQAVQTNGFANAQTALDTAFGKAADKAAEWFNGAVASTSVSTNEAFKEALTSDEKTIVVSLNSDVTYDVTAWENNAMGGDATKNIIINGNGYTVTFNQTNSDWNNIVTNGAKLTINNAKITNAGYNNGPWNRHDLNFACEVELNDVVSDKAFAFKAGATLNNVTIDDANTSDTYAIWIQPNGQTVTLNGCTIDMLDCTDGRGIKIDEQYVSDPAKVTLNVSNTTFKTEEKSAILVKSAAGADITLENLDITSVAADPINHVWVDEASAAYADLVAVTGGNKIIEGQQADPSTIVIIKNADELFAFAKDVNSNNNKYSGKTVILATDIDLQNKPWTPIGQTGATEFRGTFDGQNHTIKNLFIDNSSYTDEHTSTGLFGWAERGVTIKNVKVDGASVKGNHNVAVIVGYTYSGKITNCHVSNATVVCNHANGDACGDKAGTIAGYTADEARLTNCTASNSTVKAGRDAGQLFGLAYTASVSNCSATNVEVSATGDCNREGNINNAVIGRVMG